MTFENIFDAMTKELKRQDALPKWRRWLERVLDTPRRRANERMHAEFNAAHPELSEPGHLDRLQAFIKKKNEEKSHT